MVEDFRILNIHLGKGTAGPKSSNYRAYSQMSHGIEDVVVWTEDQVAGFQTEQDAGSSTPRDRHPTPQDLLPGKCIQEDHSIGHLCLWNRDKETNMNLFKWKSLC